MSSDEKRTFHPTDRSLYGNVSPVPKNEYRNGCSGDLFISEPFQTTQNATELPRLRYETVTSTSQTKRLLRRDERSMSLRRPPKKLEDFDRSLSISLEEILQGINETKSPPAAPKGSLLFSSPLASPEQTIDGQFTEYPVDVVFPETEKQCHRDCVKAAPWDGLSDVKFSNSRRHASRLCSNDCDSNNNANFRTASKNKNDVIRDRREELSNPFPNRNFQNKPSLPPGHSEIDIPIAAIGGKCVDTDRSNNCCDASENDTHSAVLHGKRTAVPPNSLRFVAQEYATITENDLSPSSNEVHDILRHASAEYDMSDEDLSSCFDTDEENSNDSSSATREVFAEYCTQMSSLTLVPSEDETIVGSYGGL